MCSHLMLIRWLAVVCYITRIADITDISQNPDTSWISMFFHGFERAKPLQTFSALTTPRVRRSEHCLGLHSRRNIGKTSKNRTNPTQISTEKGYKRLNWTNVLCRIHRPYPVEARWVCKPLHVQPFPKLRPWDVDAFMSESH